MRLRAYSWLFLLLIIPAFAAFAETKTVLILHTNDLHDHIRPAYDGAGGLPYVSGYIKSVLKERKDAIALDAGDLTEKGDMVAYKTESKVMYEAMGKIGYAAETLGNHDVGHGSEFLLASSKLTQDMAMLCINYVKPDGTTYFPASKVFDVNRVKVGVIGVTLPKGDAETLDDTATYEAVAKEAQRLRKEADLIVALCHLGSGACKKMAAIAPDVQVFVSGHTHEVIPKPIVADKSGALIVQAGEYAQHVGWLELSVDLDTHKVVASDGHLVKLEHDKVPCDDALLAWARDEEKKICPDAARVIANTDKPVERSAVARLAAEALRRQAQADVGFCHPGQVIRSGLPAGALDVNAFFRTGGQRGDTVVTTTLAGDDIAAYLVDLMTFTKGQTEWAGFKATLDYDATAKKWNAKTDLDPKRTYKVALPQLEWTTRFEKVVEKHAKAGGEPAAKHETAECAFSFIDAVAAYADSLNKEGVRIDAQVEKLKTEQAL